MPSAITSAIKKYVTLKLSLSECAYELKCKKVMNIKYKVHRSIDTRLIENLVLKLDISESIFYLREYGYLVENYHIF